MNRSNAVLLLSAITALVAFSGVAGSESRALRCIHSSYLAAAESAEQRQYAPDRDIQVLHVALDVTPDFKQRSITGQAVLRFKPVAKPIQEVKLDAIDLRVSSLAATEEVQAYQVTDENIIITFARPIPADKETVLTINYSAEPKEGLYFRTPEMGYKPGDTHLFSQGEETGGRSWYPCVDSPNQVLTSEITCRVPEGMTVVSNGRLLSENKDPSGLVAFHWSQDKPHANYLLSLLAGYFKKLEDKCNNLPLAFYTPASEIAYAETSFRDTKDMVQFFEREIGIPYPWDKYYQVCVNDFVAGGMENTSVTTLTDGTLFTEATENINSSEGLVAHELAHQWFGDLVTCKDWSHTWLNEGFATYYESLYAAHKHGRDAMLYELYQRARDITGIENDFNAIVRRTYKDTGEMFGYLSYPKGGWVLHMLRSQLGDDLYRRCIQTYLQRYRHKNVVTDDLRAVLEELSGRSFDQFFDQWLYHGRFPELDVAYSWDESARLVKVTVNQVQEVSAKVLLFNFPLTIRLKGSFGTEDRLVQVSKKREDFYFPLPSAPQIVRVDPEYTLLAKTKFSVSMPLLLAQASDSKDAVGRLLAIEQFAARRNHESVSKLQEMLNHDGFYGVRVEASRALRNIHTDEALKALLASRDQADARVRRQVLEDISGFYDGQASDAALKAVANEKNPAIVSVAIHSLGAYPQPEVRPMLLKYLDSTSFRNELAGASVRALRSQDDPANIVPLLETLSRREADFTSHEFADGLETLAYLARNEQNKDSVRDFLLARVNHNKRSVRVAALNALGTLGDPKALPAVQKFSTASKASPERGAAERAAMSLRAARKPVDDFKNLRQEVLDLQSANRELRKEIDDLKKKVEAAVKPKAEDRPPKTRIKSPKA